MAINQIPQYYAFSEINGHIVKDNGTVDNAITHNFVLLSLIITHIVFQIIGIVAISTNQSAALRVILFIQLSVFVATKGLFIYYLHASTRPVYFVQSVMGASIHSSLLNISVVELVCCVAEIIFYIIRL